MNNSAGSMWISKYIYHDGSICVTKVGETFSMFKSVIS